MLERIVRGLREYVLLLSIVLTAAGMILFLIGLFYYVIQDIVPDFFKQLEDWNAYILVFGLVVLFFGVYYLYSFFKKRNFLLQEMKTNKRSEFLKKHAELTATVKRLPSKYKKMLKEKDAELGIK